MATACAKRFEEAMSGTRVRLFPQADAGYAEPETVTLSVGAGRVGPGPSDGTLVTVFPVGKTMRYEPPLRMPPWRGPTLSPACPDAAGHLDGIPTGTPQFYATHLYGGVRLTLDVWERYLERPVRWWHAETFPRLELVPFVDWNNAHSGPGFIETGWRASSDGVRRPFALNLDVIAHEVGHAILFSELGVPPMERITAEFLALHESFSDLVALVVSLHFASVRQLLLEESSGDLYVLNSLNRIGEIGPTEQIRLAANSTHLEDLAGLDVDAEGVWQDPLGLGRNGHHLSAPLTGAVFDCFVEVYQDRLAASGVIAPDDDLRGWSPGEILVALARRGPLTGRGYARFRNAFESALFDARDEIGQALAETILALDPERCAFGVVAGQFIGALMRHDRDRNGLAYATHFRNHGIEPLRLAASAAGRSAWLTLSYAERMRRVHRAARRRADGRHCAGCDTGDVLAARSFLLHEERSW